MNEEQKQGMKGQIREIFMRNGFIIKDGQSDLKDYVYSAAYELIAALTQPPIPVLKPIELPSSFNPKISEGLQNKVVMRMLPSGKWLNKQAVIKAIESSGYKVKL